MRKIKRKKKLIAENLKFAKRKKITNFEKILSAHTKGEKRLKSEGEKVYLRAKQKPQNVYIKNFLNFNIIII